MAARPMILFVVIAIPAFMVGAQLSRSFSHKPIEGQTFDFGNGRFNDVVRHTFVVRNSNSYDIQIVRVSTSCGCTTVGALPTKIAGGGLVEIPVTAKLEKDAETFAADVILEVSRQPPVVLRVRGKVVRQLPSTIDFGTIRRGESIAKSFVLHSLDGRLPQVKHIDFSRDHFEVEHGPTTGNTTGVHFTFRLRGDAPYGAFVHPVRIHTSDSSTAHVVRLVGEVAPLVVCEPNVLSFGLVSAGSDVVRQCRLTSPYGHAVRIARIETTADSSVQLERPIEDGDDLLLNVRLTGTLSDDVLSERVVFWCELDGQKQPATLQIYAMRK